MSPRTRPCCSLSAMVLTSGPPTRSDSSVMSSFLSFSLRLRVSNALTRRSAVTTGGARHRRAEVRGAWRTSRANEKHKTRETNVEIDLDGGAPRERRRRVRVLALLLALAHVIQEGVPFRFFFLGLL